MVLSKLAASKDDLQNRLLLLEKVLCDVIVTQDIVEVISTLK